MRCTEAETALAMDERLSRGGIDPMRMAGLWGRIGRRPDALRVGHPLENEGL